MCRCICACKCMTVAKGSANKISTIPRQCHPAAITQMVMDGLPCPLDDEMWSEHCQRPYLLVILLLYVCLTTTEVRFCVYINMLSIENILWVPCLANHYLLNLLHVCSYVPVKICSLKAFLLVVFMLQYCFV